MRDTEAENDTLRPSPVVLRSPAEIPPRQWLYDEHIVAGSVSLTVSPGGLGKSSLLITEALAMAAGRSPLGPQPPRPLTVWLWNGEDPRDEIERRVAAAALHHDVTSDEIAGRLFADSGRDTPIRLAEVGKGGQPITSPVVEELVTAIQLSGVDVLIVDPFVTCHGVPENDNGAINAVIGLWRDIADRTGCGIELVHHAAKAAHLHGSDMGVAQSRGASAIIDGVRSARFLVRMSDEDREKAGLDPKTIVFEVVHGKANFSPAMGRRAWRKLTSVALGNGSGLYPAGDLVGVVEGWTPPDAFAGVSLRDLADFQAALRDGEWRASDQSHEWAGYKLAEIMRLDVGGRSDRTPDQKQNRARVKEMIATWRRNGHLKEDRRRDGRTGRESPFFVPGIAAYDTSTPYTPDMW